MVGEKALDPQRYLDGTDWGDNEFLLGIPTEDTTFLEFDFELTNGSDLFFNFVFASEEYNEFENVVRETIENYTLMPVFPSEDSVAMLCNVCKSIQTCKYAVTDISYGEDILYRMGLIHAVGLKCIILKHSRAKTPKDIQGLHILEYNNKKDLKEKLSRWVELQIPEAQITDPPSFFESKPLGLPIEIYQLLRETFLECAPFATDRELRALFIDNRLYQWREMLPQAQNNLICV